MMFRYDIFRLFGALVFFLLFAAPVFAVEPGEALKDSALELRARNISAELRCLVCQNQSIDDSQAPLAKDLRMLVRERLTAGDTDEAVRAYLVARYGDFVLLKPPFKTGTLLLWTAPFGVLALGALALVISARRRQGEVEVASAVLSAEEELRLKEAMAREG